MMLCYVQMHVRNDVNIPAVVLALLLTAPTAERAPWFQHYEQGLLLLAQGNARAASVELAEALAARPDEGLTVPTEGPHYVDYLPHLYLAIATYASGDPIAARAHLDAAERSGVAARSEVGRVLLEAYRVLLGRSGGVPPIAQFPATQAPAASYRLFPRRPPALPADEVRALASAVLFRCGLPPQAEITHGPWYFYYEVGLELEARGDPQSAIEYLIAAADRRPTPGRLIRSYGMWFVDYRPYFEIARSHSALGNWSCALDALEVSKRLGEVPADDRDFARFQQLLQEARAHQQPEKPR